MSSTSTIYDSPINILKAIPKDLVVEIVGKVASHSMADLCKVKLSCKEFLSASEDGYVYQRASIDKFALVPLMWFKGEKETSFLKRCKESGNLEILYREGMEQYMSREKQEYQTYVQLSTLARMHAHIYLEATAFAA
jgi:hypothetical protein